MRDMVRYVSQGGYLWYNGPDAVENLPIGLHEQGIIEAVEQLLPRIRCRVLVDVGAHYGLYTIRLAKHFSEVWAFEPHPHNFEILNTNIGLNSIKNVKAHRVALWDKDDEAGLEVEPGNDPAKVSGRFRVVETAGTIAVPVRRLDTLDPPEVSYIKVDVEGYAHKVLRGALNTLKKHRPVIQIEYHGEEEIQGCLQVLDMFGYSEYSRFPYPPYFLSIYMR
jgi:FkbM family methyltransferase